MKSTLVLGFILTFSNSFALAEGLKTQCAKKAAAAVEKTNPGQYDKGSAETVACKKSNDARAVVCEVMFYKGEGEAVDTFQVVLNNACSKTYSVKLTGEE